MVPKPDFEAVDLLLVLDSCRALKAYWFQLLQLQRVLVSYT